MRVAFGPFVFDAPARQLTGPRGRVHLPPKAFDLLQLLLERRPAVVTKTEVQERIWPDTFVLDANLNVLVADIRRALGDDPKAPAFIRTAHGRGYAFSGSVSEAPTERPEGAQAAARVPWCWLSWRDAVRPLVAGENVIGRDPGCAVWIDARGVSRRHAVVAVDARGATVRDLGSTNGTFVGGHRVGGTHALSDGDTLVLGGESLTFRLWSAETPPTTERIPRGPRR